MRPPPRRSSADIGSQSDLLPGWHPATGRIGDLGVRPGFRQNLDKDIHLLAAPEMAA